MEYLITDDVYVIALENGDSIGEALLTVGTRIRNLVKEGDKTTFEAGSGNHWFPYMTYNPIPRKVTEPSASP